MRLDVNILRQLNIFNHNRETVMPWSVVHLCFHHFHFFFGEVSNFSKSETSIGDKKLSVEL